VTFTGEQVIAGQKLADIYAPDLITAQQELLEAQKLLDFNPNLLEAVRNKLRYWKINESTIRSIEQSGKIQETFPLYAQESGVVSNKKVSVGDYVKQGEPLFELINLDKVWILFDAYEEDLADIRLGDRIEFTASTIPNKTFKSAITFIDPILNAETRTISLRAEISNVRGLLKPETLVYGMLNKVRKTKGQLTVPKSAVMWTGRMSVVYVKLQDTEIPSFRYKEIEIGEEIGKSYQIIKGLERGEEVVTYGSFTIDAAAQLNNQASMMNRNVKEKKDDDGQAPNFSSNTPDEFKQQLNNLINQYIILKDALVETDANQAKSSIEKLLSSLKKTDMALLKGDAHIYWMEQHNAILTHSNKITEAEDVEKQRTQFGFVSEAIIHALNAFGTIGEALYIQHCPMAFDNEGADWISNEEGIKNPYFGDKMMKCGLVKKSINLNQ
ncbi:MAG: Cu(I)/Ag(I) efflux system membrane fusion protein, partial [Maribacter sp.]